MKSTHFKIKAIKVNIMSFFNVSLHCNKIDSKIVVKQII